jgi:hypothetical protein
MMSKILYIIALAIVFCGNLFAQKTCSCSTSTDIESLLEDRVLAQAYTQKMKSPEIQFSDDWKKGEIQLTNGEVIHSVYLRYNGFADQLYWLRSRDYQISMVDRSVVKGFCFVDSMSNTSVIYRRADFIEKKLSEVPDVFLQILAEGEISLYLYHRVNYLSNTDEYYSKPEYYAKVNGEIKRISLRRRSLVRLLGEKKSEMRSIIRQNDYDLSTQQGMVAAINAFNKK